jgi:hypothetical protein
MAPPTRSKRTKKESYRFVMDKILDQELLGNIRVCLESMGVTNLDDFLDLDKESMSDFIQIGANVNGDIVTLKLSPLDIKKVLHVQAWFVHHDDPTDDTWANLTEDGYKIWKTTSQAADICTSLVPDSTSTVPTTTTITGIIPQVDSTSAAIQPQIQINSPSATGTPYTSASNNFQRGIKINISDYIELKDDKQWYKWKEQVSSIASLHQTGNVLNSEYSPGTQEEIELFGSHNRFMYTVFSECVQTSKGKICIRAHSQNYGWAGYI